MKRIFIPALFMLAACIAPYEPQAIHGAVVYLPFEGNLDNIGEIGVTPTEKNRKARYRRGRAGKALYTLGDGSWIEYKADEKIMLYEEVSISFDFKPADWKNPYGPGSASKTILDIMGASTKRIQHLAFSISKGDAPSFEVYFEDAGNQSHRLTAGPDMLSKDWSSVRLDVDRFSGKTTLFINDTLVASDDAIPAAIDNGVDVLKFGTWHRKNQAYCGAIDNFVIVELRDV